jgi:hypothetical protein
MINKSLITGFINRYYLGGNTDGAKVVLKNNIMTTNFQTWDNLVIGNVTLKNIDMPDGVLGIYTTPQLLKILNAVDENMEISYGLVDDKIYSINFRDTDKTLTYMLADLSVIRNVPNLKELPKFEVKIELDKDFVNNFRKSTNALPDTDNFGVQCVGEETKIIINHSTVNTNRIIYKVKTSEQSQMDTVCFSSKLFKEILNANADTTGIFEVSSRGLARVTFDGPDYTSTYYLVKLNIT